MLLDLPSRVIFHFIQYLDSESLKSLYLSSKHFYNLFKNDDRFWETICEKEKFHKFRCLLPTEGEEQEVRMGMMGKRIDCGINEQWTVWRKIYHRGLQMRRNISLGNMQCLRFWANKQVPLSFIHPDNHLHHLQRGMGDIQSPHEDDSVRVCQDNNHLVMFHVTQEFKHVTIFVYKLGSEPKFLYSMDRASDYVTEKIVLHEGHVFMIPSRPLLVKAVVVALSIENNMEPVGKFFPEEDAAQEALSHTWIDMKIRVVKERNLIAFAGQLPNWVLILLEAPSCTPFVSLDLSQIKNTFLCSMIRSHNESIVIIFGHQSSRRLGKVVFAKKDLHGYETTETEMMDVRDVLNHGDSGALLCLKKSGDIVLFDPHLRASKIIVDTTADNVGEEDVSDYEMFVDDGRREIFLLKSFSSSISCGNIKIFDFDGMRKLTIELDRWKFGLSVDRLLCMYSCENFLFVTDSHKIVIFNSDNGAHLGGFSIPVKLGYSKLEQHCLVRLGGVNYLKFDEGQLLLIHDFERAYPACVDLYKFI